ncbi:YqaE/Pmp3 family membrane protein [Paenibacillus sp. 102]|uniref:YqaE/Pmp3 family membrane protein n=1 Tax=Paenibacillus sp. 102 TaxID=3120823 RepID=UPI0031BB4EB4
MMYLLAILFPPLAVLLCGKPFQAVINFFLTLIVWVPGVIHAILVVNDKKADKRLKKQIRAYGKINTRTKA